MISCVLSINAPTDIYHDMCHSECHGTLRVAEKCRKRRTQSFTKRKSMINADVWCQRLQPPKIHKAFARDHATSLILGCNPASSQRHHYNRRLVPSNAARFVNLPSRPSCHLTSNKPQTMGKRMQPRLIQASHCEEDARSFKKPRVDTTIESLAHTLLSIQSDSYHTSPSHTREMMTTEAPRGHGYVSDDDESPQTQVSLSMAKRSLVGSSQHPLLQHALACPPRLATRLIESNDISRVQSSLPQGRPLPPKPVLPSGIVAFGTKDKMM